MALDWLPGVVAGVLAGGVPAWINRPSRQAAAQADLVRVQVDAELAKSSALATAETERQQLHDIAERRRALIADGRQLVSEAMLDGRLQGYISEDRRYLALARHLLETTRGAYEPGMIMASAQRTGASPYQPLLDNLDMLEQDWKLT